MSRLLIRDVKSKITNCINIEHVRMIEFSKTQIKIIFKDNRQDTLTIKANQIIIE